MFPGGSPALVEPIYSSPLLSAPFNEQLAAAVVAYMRASLQASMRPCMHFVQAELRLTEASLVCQHDPAPNITYLLSNSCA